MTDSRAAAEPDVTRFESEVTAVEDGGEIVELAESYFYPAGGGQPADRGTLAGVSVEHVASDRGTVRHVLAEPAAVEPGDVVVGQIDPAFRRYCRRAHTASHVLYGAGRRLFTELGYGGFDIDVERVRVDLRVPAGIGDEELVELERLTNRAVWESRAVSWELVPPSEARSREAVAFNSATEEGVMAEADSIRLVTVEDWDVAACGGTHVRNTREIGPVTVLDRSNPGEGLTRVEFAVGPTGIEHRAAERRALRAAATDLGVPTTEVDAGVADLQDRYEAVSTERDALKSEVLGARLEGLDVVDRPDGTWQLGVIEDFGPNEVGERIRDPGPAVDTIAVAGEDGATFLVVASNGEVDAGAVVDAVTEAFGGGGGGGPAFAQGGGLDVAPDRVVAFLEEY
ncbi:MAG: alanyl-tRNA editing protein [Halobacteriaceae archaeon]